MARSRPLVVRARLVRAAVRASTDELEAERDQGAGAASSDYRSKLAQAVNLTELRKQKLQVQEYVTQLEKQLPGKAEMDALLSDINQAGLGRGLQFELFRPGQVAVKDYYAELPIAIRVTGRYHDIGSFAADVANLSRIVTLHNLTIAGRRQGRRRHAGHGSHRANLPLPRRQRSRRADARPSAPRQGREPRNESPSRIAHRWSSRRRAVLLAGCGVETRRTAEWMEQQRREVKPNVHAAVAAEEVRPAAVRERAGGRAVQQAEADASRSSRRRRQPNSLLAAELNRRKEPLEAYPLDSMAMVGSVDQARAAVTRC